MLIEEIIISPITRSQALNSESSFLAWVKEIAQVSIGEVIVIDGEVARRSFTTKERRNPLHMVSAWSCRNGIVLGQQKVSDKSNVITAIPVLLDFLELKGVSGEDSKQWWLWNQNVILESMYPKRHDDKKVYMILAHHTLDNFNFKDLTDLTYKLSHFQPDITLRT